MRKYFLIFCLFLLMVLSLSTLQSIAPDLLNKQLFAYLLGFGIFFSVSRLPFAFSQRLSPYLYWALNLVLLVLLLLGQVTRGIVAWIQLPFGLRFQPSQLAVVMSALFLANYLGKSKTKLAKSGLSWSQLFYLLIHLMITGALILFAPDFGTAAVYFFALGSFLVFIRLGWIKILSFIAAGLLVSLALWFFVLADFQKARLTNFFNLSSPELVLSSELKNESSAAYNARQSLIAVGAGRFWGQGLGQGTQSHLKFLPERQTDFIFASFVEEWGFLGASLILSLYFALLLFLLYLIFQENELSRQLYLLAIFSMLLIQIFINIGMNLALVPITGITLPFLSYGGSSVLSFFFALALVQRILLEQEKGASSIFQ